MAQASPKNGPSALQSFAVNLNPASMAESLQLLDDGHRVMLLKAAQRDGASRKQAIATLPLWWGSMPEETRHNIEFKVDAWLSKRKPKPTAAQIASRKVAMLLPHVARRRSGAQRLAVAARLPK